MKKIGTIVVLFLMVSTFFYVINSHKEIQVVKEDNSAELANAFLENISQVKNEEELTIIVGEVDYTKSQKKIYISNQFRVMVPLEFITDALNCSVRRYDDGKMNISKGDNDIILNIDSAVAVVNDKVIGLGSKVIEEDKRIYIPINNIVDFLGYAFHYSIEENAVRFQEWANVELPKKYDMRDTDRVTEVRDQGKYGTCWAFVALAAVETTVMPLEKMIFSPDHMSLCNGFNLSQDEGGDYTMAIAYMASWKGPVLEEDDPYGDGITNERLKAVKHLEEAMIIESKDYEAIKLAVYKYGAVETSIYTQLRNANSWSSYYNRDRATYYYDGESTPNHDVLIIGWDDGFPKDYFTNTPEGDGAFICKNSWGTEFGDEGYFYVSYYDTVIGTTNVVYSKIGDGDNYDNIYQSDLLGWIGQLGYNSEEAYFANIYQTADEEKLEAVGFYATGKNTEYKVYVVRNFENVDSLNSRQLVAEGSLNNAGYYTIGLDSGVNLNADEKYAVVVYVKTPRAIHPVAIEYESDSRTSTFDISDGEGYISLYGQVWMSAEDKQSCNICLKAFTNDR